MKLIIHSGANKIGGSCVELRTAKSRILIDFGMPLVTDKKVPFDPAVLKGKSVDELRKLKILPDIEGLYNGIGKTVDAILISHSHMDHYGLLNYIRPGIPVCMSQGANELIEITSLFTPNKIGKINKRIIKAKKAFQVGDLTIIPYQVDHSAFDALAFLVEGDGKKVFYSGDFRGHGRKSVLFENIVKHPPEEIDCLLMEGSMLGRGEQSYKNERFIQTRIEEILKSASTISFLFASSQNIDRLVSAYKACLKTNSTLVLDLYTAYILDKLRKVSPHIPQFNWRNIRIKFYKYQADVLANHISASLLYHYNSKKIDMFEINKKKSKMLMLARDNSIFPSIIKEIDGISGAKIIYSMWQGYLTHEFEDFCAEKSIEIEHVHTSGHATIEDLQAFSNALTPRTLIPIHTFDSDKYPDLFNNVRILKDEEVLLL